MTTRLRLATVAIGTVLLTTSALADDMTPFAGIVLVSPAGYTATPTLVQQLTAKLAYQQEALAENPNNTYLGPASKRTAKKLAAARAAEAAGTPLPPMLSENGGVVPLSKFGGNYGEAPATPVPYGEGLLRVAKSLAAATSEGTLSLTPDTGLPSLTPDTGLPSANPDTGLPSANPDTGLPSANPDTSIASSNPDTGIKSSNPDTGIKSSNPDGGAARGGG